MSTPPSSDETIFAGAVTHAASERATFLDQACAGDPAQRARLDALLRAHDEASHLLATSAFVSPPPVTAVPTEKPGDRIGRYKLLQQVGEGGCGIVYLAEQQEPIVRRVALKVIKLGMDTREVVARFEAERQALALMNHPNIASVLDGGATERGRPFFVMELVRGVPITKYCDEQNLSTAARLELFTAVCHAVQHAHQKGIIHRDLKPSNILVTLHDGKPVPKVIDFGIAKATQGKLTDATLFTAFEQFIGTPAYMSPEQAELSGLDIDTRSDIYSLGVLLYELLTGRPPFDPKTLLNAGLDEIRRIIREVDPPRPSTRLSTLTDADRSTVARMRGIAPARLSTLLRGDLDWIVMRCLEKDRTRRYETPTSLAADIARHLTHEPVSARPPSAAYLLQRLIQRHRVAVGAGAAIAASLLLGLATSIALLLREQEARRAAVTAEKQTGLALADAKEKRAQAEREKQRADNEAALAKAVSDFLQNDILSQANSAKQIEEGFEAEPNLTVLAALDRASERVTGAFKDRPVVEASVRMTLASAYHSLGNYDAMCTHVTRALELRRAFVGGEQEETIRTMYELSDALTHLGQFAEGIALIEKAIEISRRTLGPFHRTTLDCLSSLATGYSRAGKFAESIPRFEEVLKAQKEHLGVSDSATRTTMGNLALDYGRTKRTDESIRLMEESLRISREHHGEKHPSTLLAMSNLANAYQRASRLEEAQNLLIEALALKRAVLGPDHPNTLSTMNNLASVHRSRKRPNEAAALLEEALRLGRSKLGADHPGMLANLGALATAYEDGGRPAKALPLREERLNLSRAKFGADHPESLKAAEALSTAYRTAGRHTEAIQLMEATLPAENLQSGRLHAKTMIMMQNLGRSYYSKEMYAKAESVQRDLVARAREFEGPTPSWRTAEVIMDLAYTCQRLQKFVEVEALAREALAIRRRLRPTDWLTASAESVLGAALLAQEKFAEAEPLLLSGWQGIERGGNASTTNWRSHATNALERLVRLYTQRHQPEEASQWQARLVALDPSRAPAGPVEDRLLQIRRSTGQLTQAGRYLDAIPLYLEALKIQEGDLGPDHPDTLETMNLLAVAYRNVGRFAESVALHENVLARRRVKLGPEHSATLISMNNLAVAYRSVGRLNDAITVDEETLRLRRAKLGPGHPDTLLSMSNLASDLSAANRAAEAIPLYDELLTLRRAKLGATHSDTIKTLGSFASALELGNDYPRAEQHRRESLELRLRLDGAHSLAVATAQSNLGANLLQQAKYSEAESVLRVALATREEKQPDHWSTGNTRSQLGGALLGQKNFSAAEPLLLRGYEELKRHETAIPTDSWRLLRLSILRLVQLYQSRGDSPQVAEWQRKLDTLDRAHAATP